MAVATLLQWCKDVIRKNLRTLDEAGKLLPATLFALLPAAWVFYCCCVFEMLINKPLVQHEPTAFRTSICSHRHRKLVLDVPLALAVITETFCSVNPTTRPIIGTDFSSQCMEQIDAILHDRATRCQDIARAYFSRIKALPSEPEALDLSGGARAILVKEYIKKAVQARRSSLQVDDTRRTRTMPLAFSYMEVLSRTSPIFSIERSIRSSLNTIRSSMSLDTKQMLELKQRIRRPNSFLSIRSKDTTYSHAMSIDLRSSDSFEGVTGMPSCGPAADLEVEPVACKDTIMTEQTDEETNDVVMNNDNWI